MKSIIAVTAILLWQLGAGLIPSRETALAVISLETATRSHILTAQELPKRTFGRTIELTLDPALQPALGKLVALETDRGVYLAIKLSETTTEQKQTIVVALTSTNPIIGVGLEPVAIVTRLKLMISRQSQPLPVQGTITDKVKLADGRWRIVIETAKEPPATVGTKAIIEYVTRP